ncbi:hypothetical protein HPP92_025144 [Vanilla planifolia]|uniref:Uncharacterized protein n=1 Tax=Vanilla planifolia TaxID=51239 RepID=A0A835PK22_VANPL|nr:hypothetical protein HPP92_025144 [Vanilla planifolia]
MMDIVAPCQDQGLQIGGPSQRGGDIGMVSKKTQLFTEEAWPWQFPGENDSGRCLEFSQAVALLILANQGTETFGKSIHLYCDFHSLRIAQVVAFEMSNFLRFFRCLGCIEYSDRDGLLSFLWPKLYTSEAGEPVCTPLCDAEEVKEGT